MYSMMTLQATLCATTSLIFPKQLPGKPKTQDSGPQRVRPDCGTRPGQDLYPGLCEKGTHARLSPGRELVCLHPDGRLQGGRARKGNRSGCESLLTPQGLEMTSPSGGPLSPHWPHRVRSATRETLYFVGLRMEGLRQGTPPPGTQRPCRAPSARVTR